MNSDPPSPHDVQLDVEATMSIEIPTSTVVVHVITGDHEHQVSQASQLEDHEHETQHSESDSMILSESVVLSSNSDLVNHSVYEPVILNEAGPMSSVGMLPSPAALTSSVLSSPLCSVLPVETDDDREEVERHVIDVLRIPKNNSLDSGLEFASRESVAVDPHSPKRKFKSEQCEETHLVTTTSSDNEQLLYEQTSGEPIITSVRFGITTTSPDMSYIYSCQWANCVQQFISQEDLVTHVNEYHIQTEKNEEYCCKWLECPRNGKGFNARYKMLIHMRTHTGERPHKCPQASCEKSFSRLENLKIHCRSHTGDKPYACPYDGCDKRYSNSSDRYKHTRTHLEKKPYHCKIKGCAKQYTDPSSLRKHLKSHQRVQRVILMVDEEQEHDPEEMFQIEDNDS